LQKYEKELDDMFLFVSIMFLFVSLNKNLLFPIYFA